jgi:uncharacterized protein YjbJ (UPF0337 family)
MKNTKVNGFWILQKGRLKQFYGFLKSNNRVQAEGKKEEMFGRLQIKTGKTEEELHEIIRIFNQPLY